MNVMNVITFTKKKYGLRDAKIGAKNIKVAI